MPQMSPMSWLLILSLLFFMILVIFNTFKSFKMNLSTKKSFQKKHKSLMW